MGKAYEDYPDTFGPWTPPGKDGKDPVKDKKDPTPTTPAIVTPDGGDFWDSATEGYVQFAPVPSWSRCRLGKYDLPGVVSVKCPMPKLEVDKKKVKGQGAAKVTIQGWTNADVSIECLLWTPSHYQQWRKLEMEIAPELQKKDPPAYDIVSPLLNPRITSVLVLQVSALEDGRTAGSKIGKIACMQNVPKPKPAGGTPGKSTGKPFEQIQQEIYGAYAALYALIVVGRAAPVEWITFLYQHGAAKDPRIQNIKRPSYYVPPPMQAKLAIVR